MGVQATIALEDRETILHLHNCLRMQTALGYTIGKNALEPYAGDMRMMVWNLQFDLLVQNKDYGGILQA